MVAVVVVVVVLQECVVFVVCLQYVGPVPCATKGRCPSAVTMGESRFACLAVMIDEDSDMAPSQHPAIGTEISSDRMRMLAIEAASSVQGQSQRRL